MPRFTRAGLQRNDSDALRRWERISSTIIGYRRYATSVYWPRRQDINWTVGDTLLAYFWLDTVHGLERSRRRRILCCPYHAMVAGDA